MKKILVHLHLYYHNQLDYMIDKLSNIEGCKWDLFVTVCEDNEASKEKILSFKKDAKIIKLGNVGYDLYPFVHILSLVDLDKYDYIIKLHTKSTYRNENPNDLRFKSNWRNMLVTALLNNKEKFKENLEIFESNPKVGMIGCQGLVHDISTEAKENIPVTNSLLEKLGIKKREGKFVAGTMFMARAKLMQPLKDLKLSPEKFKKGISNKTGDAGTLAHALESIVGAIISSQKYTIQSVEGYTEDYKPIKGAEKGNLDGIKYLAVMYNDLGILNQESKDFEKALKYFEEALKHFDMIYNNLAQSSSAPTDILEQLAEEMEEIRRNILNLLNQLGEIKLKNDDPHGALEHFKEILYYDSNNENIYIKISKCLRTMGAFISAISFLDKALKLNPEHYEIHRIMGDIYQYNIEDLNLAIESYEKYVDAENLNMTLKAVVYNIIGHLYATLSPYENIEKQVYYFEKALEIDPNFKCALRNVTIVAPRIGQDQKALECFRKLLRLGATMDDHFNYAAHCIKMGDFKEGWKYYDYRFSKETNATVYPTIDKPRWKGQKITDKVLLVHHEQGFGDSLQFFRYLPQLKPLAKKIMFKVQNELYDLFSYNNNEIEIVQNSTKFEKISFDLHVPLMSLMHFLNATKENIPSAEGYLKANPNRIKEYKKEYFDNDCFKIGITWEGAAAGNKKRNVPLEAFYALAKLKNVKVYSFQKGIDSNLLKNLPKGVEIIDLGKTFKSFADTAAAMANLDLFVTSDNSVFNLAGALGQRTFLLMNKDSEWRWFLDDKTTPWYKSVQIFKKENELDSWDLLIDRVIKTISKEIK